LAWLIVAAAAGYSLISWGIHVYGSQFNATAKIEAKIYDTRTESADNDVGGGVEYTVGEYEFRVNGRLYNGETTGDFQPGDVITVVYNPADPTQNREETDTQDLTLFTTFALVVLVVGVRILSDRLQARRNKRLREKYEAKSSTREVLGNHR
jgi:hypothetical protein